MNIIFSGFFHPIIGIITGLLLVFGSEFVGKISLRKFINTFFFLNFIFGLIIVSLINFILILIGLSKFLSIIFTYVLLLFGFYNFFLILKKFNFSKILYYESYFILLIIFLLLILSVTPPTMADSLDYHLGVANFVNQNYNWPNPNMWLHANISGLGEVYNFLGLNVYSDVAGSLSQVVGLASFLHYFSNVIKNYQKKILFNLFIISSPVIIFLVSGAKFLLLPQLTTTLVLYYLVSNKKLNENLFLLIVFLLCGAANFKLSFLISGLVLGLVALMKIKITSKIFVKSTLIILFFFLPKALFNFFNYGDFGLLNIFVVAPDEFLLSLNHFQENHYTFPLNLFIPESLGKLSTVLGLQVFLFLLLKNICKENKKILIIATVVSALYYFFSMSIGRMYFEILLWFSLFFIFPINFRINLSIIKIYLILNTLTVFMLIIFGLYNLAPGLLNNNFREEVMKKNAYEYNAASWINEKIDKNKIILTNIRSVSLLNNYTIPMDYLNYRISDDKLKNYVSFLKESKINLLVLKNFTEESHYLFKNCKEISRIKSPLFIKETRNPFNRQEKYFVVLIEFEKEHLNKCIQN
jgi:hypothetical protein